MRRAFFVALCLISTIPAHSVVTIDTEIVKKSVVFIYAANANGEVDESKQVGTGFLMSVPKKGDAESIYAVLITARHIVDPSWAGCPVQNPSRLYIRVNKTGYDSTTNTSGVAFVPIELMEKGQATWVVSKDEHVDAAVLPFPKDLASNLKGYEIKAISYRDFGSPEEIKKLGIGSDVASAGLVPGLQGLRRNFPIFKFGKVANIPDELATFKCAPNSPDTTIRVWWLAMNQVRGNSGAPIFFTPLFAPGGDITNGEPRPMIIGLQSLATDSADIAGMTPAEYILQIIGEHLPADADLSVGHKQK